jgi:thiamine pyrophosphate-dependent acetolactate synthase large subunit-like protein
MTAVNSILKAANRICRALIIHVEIDPSEIDKNVKASLAINADTGEVLKLLAGDPELISKPRRYWFELIERARGEIAGDMQKEIEAGVGQDGRLLMKRIIKNLSDKEVCYGSKTSRAPNPRAHPRPCCMVPE